MKDSSSPQSFGRRGCPPHVPHHFQPAWRLPVAATSPPRCDSLAWAAEDSTTWAVESQPPRGAGPRWIRRGTTRCRRRLRGRERKGDAERAAPLRPDGGGDGRWRLSGKEEDVGRGCRREGGVSPALAATLSARRHCRRWGRTGGSAR